MRGKFPNAPAQMEVLPFAGRHGENIYQYNGKRKEKGSKRGVLGMVPKPSF
jgi:hypothetical protein